MHTLRQTMEFLSISLTAYGFRKQTVFVVDNLTELLAYCPRIPNMDRCLRLLCVKRGTTVPYPVHRVTNVRGFVFTLDYSHQIYGRAQVFLKII